MVYLSKFRTLAILVIAIVLAACAGEVPDSTPSAAIPTNPGLLVPTEPLVAATSTGALPAQVPTAPVGETEPLFLPTVPKAEDTPQATALPQDATVFPDPDGYAWTPVASGLDGSLGVVSARDGSGRLFIVEKGGVIRILAGGSMASEPFLDIQDRVGSSGSEQGLLGLDFHPNFQENGYFYVNYTDRNGDTVIARFQATPSSGNQADPQSEQQLLNILQPYPNHNGGSVEFGPDGYLYLGLGDGGSGGDPQGNAQSLDTLLGKVLRLDVDSGDPYGIPTDNPFAAGGGKPEIWAYGLRNPWRFSFDRLTGDLYLADVGQNQWEEINVLPAGSPGGANFGWDYLEGTHPYEGTPPEGLNLIAPVAEYDHSQGCSVTGGVVVRNPSSPEWAGIYLFGDYCTGLVWGLLQHPDGRWEQQLLFEGLGNIAAFGEGEEGEVYLADLGGTVYQLTKP